MVGVIMVIQQPQPCGDLKPKSGNTFLGVAVSLLMALSSGFAGVFFEKMLKNKVRLQFITLQLGMTFIFQIRRPQRKESQQACGPKTYN